jgi:hypothetical protein
VTTARGLVGAPPRPGELTLCRNRPLPKVADRALHGSWQEGPDHSAVSHGSPSARSDDYYVHNGAARVNGFVADVSSLAGLARRDDAGHRIEPDQAEEALRRLHGGAGRRYAPTGR